MPGKSFLLSLYPWHSCSSFYILICVEDHARSYDKTAVLSFESSKKKSGFATFCHTFSPLHTFLVDLATLARREHAHSLVYTAALAFDAVLFMRFKVAAFVDRNLANAFPDVKQDE